jgi:UDP:flavonoid glycosyltransferase YjiC (YdhE family)
LSRFLFAWELGGGLGHVGKMLPVALALRAAGHEAVLALRDLRTLAELDSSPDIPVLQAPFCLRNYQGLQEPPLNYAEVLMRYGYLDAPMLAGMVRGWRSLVEITRADIIVADHAPTAMLAARTLSLRCAVLANAFIVPPRTAPTPNMRPWLQIPAGRLEDSDKRVLEVMNTVQSGSGTPAIAHLYELFDVNDIVMTTFPELDPYPRRETDPARMVFCGPITALGAGEIEPAWPKGSSSKTGKRIFAYLKPDYPHLAALLATLAACGEPCLIYGLGAGSAAAPQSAANLAYSQHPVDLAKLAGECAIGICHAGGTTAALLQGGCAMLLLPMQLEQFLSGSRVGELGAGIVINPEQPQPDIAGALNRLLTEPQFRENAIAFATRYRAWSPARILDHAVGRLVAAASGKTGKRRQATGTQK